MGNILEQKSPDDASQGILGSGHELGLPGVSPAIFRRDDPPITTLKNNYPARSTISPGTEQYWEFPLSELEKVVSPTFLLCLRYPAGL